MSQMVLPQTPAPGIKNDVTGGSSTGSAQRAEGESRYESISRAEQKRLDRQQADRRAERANERANENAKESARESTRESTSESARNRDRARSEDREPAEAAGMKQAGNETESAADADKVGETGQAEVSEGAARTGGESAEAAAEFAVPTTFAELQALLLPAGASATSSSSGPVNGVPGQAESMASLMPGAGVQKPGLSGKPGQGSQSAPGLTAGLQLTETLASTLGNETSRPTEPASLIAAGRFQSSLEVAGQQAANAAATRLPAEASVPLKSYATSIDTPVGQADWGDKLVGKLSWLTARNMSVAEIHLTPPDMGPMEVKVRVQNEQANITVHAANPVVREQLEQQSHRLRDMLGEQGLNLTQFDVSDQPQQRSGEQESGDEQGSGGRAGSGDLKLAEVDETDLQLGSLDLSWKGEIDLFA